MLRLHLFRLVICAAFFLEVSSVSAELFDRGGGLIYDDVLDVTWLQDANYAQTLGYDLDGRMEWEASKSWAESVAYFDPVRQYMVRNWRLPKLLGNTAEESCQSGFDGTNCGFNVTPLTSELAHLFYVSLGNLAVVDNSGSVRTGEPGVDFGIVNAGPFANLVNNYYWLNDVYYPDPDLAWVFNTAAGFQGQEVKSGYFNRAMLVHDGDVAAVAPVPEPEIYAMMGIGLGVVGWMARRKKKRSAA
jgi:PEP-CTERM motif